jgi:hypothetical protein
VHDSGALATHSGFVIFYDLYDALDEKGVNVIEEWTRRLEKTDRARLNLKLEMLQKFKFEQMTASKVLHGPINKTGHIFKLRAQTNVAMRPLLCRGPIENLMEYTLLFGTFETGGILTPSDVRRAVNNRDAILTDPKNRRERHVRIG